MEEGKAYIESGILELYVLGQLNPEECADVEVMAAKFPEIREEITAIEIAMERYAMSQAIEPTQGVDSMLQRIQNTDNLTQTATSAEGRVPTVEKSLHADNRVRNLRFALAACIALLIVSIVALFSVHNQLGSARDRIADLSAEREQFTATVSYMEQTNAELQKIADMGADPDWKTVRLAGTPMDPNAKMIVYWHTSGKHVMLDNSKMQLPTNDKSHQYQLWALVNGKPVDLGVFDVNTSSKGILLNMKQIANAQTFAVTLEKRGGSPAPTMDQMIVAGNVSI